MHKLYERASIFEQVNFWICGSIVHPLHYHRDNNEVAEFFYSIKIWRTKSFCALVNPTVAFQYPGPSKARACEMDSTMTFGLGNR